MKETPRRPRTKRLPSNAEIVRRCGIHWIQSGLPASAIEEILVGVEDELEVAQDKGFDRRMVLSGGVREFAAEIVREYPIPNRRARIILKWLLLGLSSVCVVVLPQHLLLAVRDVPLGWHKLLAIAAVFAVLSSLNFPWLSSRTYNGSLSRSILRYPCLWTFLAALPLGFALRVYDFKPPAERVLVWPWQLSLALGTLTALASVLYAAWSAGGVVSHRLCDTPGAESGEAAGKGGRRYLLTAILCLAMEVLGWWLSVGAMRDLASLAIIFSCLALVASLPPLDRRPRARNTSSQ